VYPVLPMSLDRCVCGLYHLSRVVCTLCYLCLWTVVCVVFIICLVFCVPCVTYVSGPLCVWSLSFVLCLVYPVLPMSLDRCLCGLYHLSRVLGYTRHKTNDKNHTHNGPETSVTQGTQDTRQMIKTTHTICLVSCVPCVTYVSGPLCVWFLSFVLCFVYPVLPMSLDRCVCGLYHLSCV
jgi:uncharacterized Tic20 family protein